MTNTTKQRVSTALPTAWQRAEAKVKTFDSDAVIDAYLAGRKDGFTHGMNEMQRATTELLKNNAAKVASYTLEVFEFLKGQDVIPVDAYLKVLSWDELNVLVLVEEETFLKPDFKSVYNLVYDLEDASEAQNLALNFSFAPVNDSFNTACMNADGFTLRFEPSDEVATA